MRRIEWGTIAFIILWIVISLWMLIYNKKVEAQDMSITVCRDTSVDTPRFEFHNLPQSWQDGTQVYWSLSDGGGFVDGVLYLDALTEYEDNPQGITAGMALVGSVDYSIEVRGDASTPDCEPVEVTPEAPVAQAVQQPIPVVMSTGRTCVIKYPEIILVCNG
jgi:hypothetical protein